jgi:hypothetical protein
MEDKINPTSPAYPTHGGIQGMNLRTALAKDAMNGILAGRDTTVLSQNELHEIAESAIRMADMLIEKLNKL